MGLEETIEEISYSRMKECMKKGVGMASVIVGTIIGLYYNVIVAWCMYYFIASMTSSLPWTSCQNVWNSQTCYDPTDNTTFYIANLTNRTSPTEEYFYREVLGMTEGYGLDSMGAVQWKLALLLAVAWLIVFLVLLKGIGSLGKVSYFTSLFPYVMMTIMLIRGATLPGSLDGVKYYLTPDWSKLAEAQVWGDAATQIFYSLGCSMAVLISMSSYNDFNNNIIRDAMLIPCINCLTSFYCGFVIFATLGYMAHVKGVPVQDVVASGPGLVFIVYPEGLAQMPAAPVWAVLFFLMMTTLGFSSQFSQVEGAIVPIMDEFPSLLKKGRRPVIFRGLFIITLLLLGLPMVTQGGSTLLNIIDVYSGGYPLIIIGVLELISVNYIYGFSRWQSDLVMMVGNKKRAIWVFTFLWCFVSPSLLMFTFVFKASQERGPTLSDYSYPLLGTVLAFLVAGFPLVTICSSFIYQIHLEVKKNKTDFSFGTLKEALKRSCHPTSTWGPALEINRTGDYGVIQSALYDKQPTNKIASIEKGSPVELEGCTNPGFQNEVITSHL